MKNNCKCEISKNYLPFEMPEEIINSLKDNNLVLFAGAGISTENKLIFKETLYEDIKSDLEIDRSVDISFPDLMSKYVDKNINGRQKLLEKIKFRFDCCHQFEELYRAASRFHDEIAPIWMMKNIITTNWDDYFERKCGAIPIVTPEDFAFNKIDQRKVFKIHGSISNYGSIIATTQDYENCYKSLNTGIIGATLKTILATKTVIFVGYSFSDFDFIKILNFLKKEMKDILPHIYIVTLDNNLPKKLQGIKSTIIKTDGIYFFSKVREHLEKLKLVIPKDYIARIYEVGILRNTAHDLVSEDFEKRCLTSLVYCLFYQDGLKHAIDYLNYKMLSGESYNPHQLINQFESYSEGLRPLMIKAKNYPDVSYVDGYIKGLTIPLYDKFKLEEFPLFYIYGKGPINDVKEFQNIILKNKIYHKTAEKLGDKYFKSFINSNLIPHHKPFF